MKSLYTASLLILGLLTSSASAQHRGGGSPHVGGGYRGVAPSNFNRAGYGYHPYVNNYYRGGYGYNPYYGLGLGFGGFGYGFSNGFYGGNLGYNLYCPYPYGSQAYANCFFLKYGYYPY